MVYLLGAVAFVTSTSEFMVAGLLVELSGGLQVPVEDAGLTITVFALGIIVGSPAMALLTLGMPHRGTLVLALTLFAIAHFAAALTSSFFVLLLARFVSALATGAFWSVSAVVVSASVPTAKATRAMGALVGGLSTATAFGIPLGTAAGLAFGWRGPFWICAVAGLLSAVAVRAGIPPSRADQAPRVRDQVASIRVPRLWAVYGVTVLFQGSVLAAYAFIAPYLDLHIGLAEGVIPVVLLLFGLGAVAGSTLGGRWGDARPSRTLACAFSVLVVVLAGLATTTSPLLVCILVATLGIAGYAPNPVLLLQAIRLAGGDSTLAVALSTSSFNLGIASATWLAAETIPTRLGLTGPAIVGCGLAVLALLALLCASLGAARKQADSAPTCQP